MWRHDTWLNEPRTWSVAGSELLVTTDANTDFWRETGYGFTRDSGHFLGHAAESAFTAQLRVRADYNGLYDQAGLMVRLDAAHWVKMGVEVHEGRLSVGSVLTAERSDWATGGTARPTGELHSRATVQRGVLRLDVSDDGHAWRLIRLAPFPRAASYQVGPMCCTPERAGLQVTFSDFSMGPALAMI